MATKLLNLFPLSKSQTLNYEKMNFSIKMLKINIKSNYKD